MFFGRLVFLIYKNAELNRRSRQERMATRLNSLSRIETRTLTKTKWAKNR